MMRIFLERAGEKQRAVMPEIPIIKPVSDALMDTLGDTPEEKSWKGKIANLEKLQLKIAREAK